VEIEYPFNITVHSDDLAVIYCLRALSDLSQKTGNTRKAWGGTKRKDWERSGHRVTFHFSDPTYRTEFVNDAKRLLDDRWTEVSRTPEK
jgi:hypothetical protein